MCCDICIKHNLSSSFSIFFYYFYYVYIIIVELKRIFDLMLIFYSFSQDTSSATMIHYICLLKKPLKSNIGINVYNVFLDCIHIVYWFMRIGSTKTTFCDQIFHMIDCYCWMTEVNAILIIGKIPPFFYSLYHFHHYTTNGLIWYDNTILFLEIRWC